MSDGGGAATAAGGSGYQLLMEHPGAVAVSMALTPQQSVVLLLQHVASGRCGGGQPGLLRAIGSALRPQARFALGPFAAPDTPELLDCCTPVPPLADVSVAEQVECLRELPGQLLDEQLHALYGDRIPPCWRPADAQPRRWLRALADASVDTWKVAAPRWRAAGPLLDREARRIGIAAVRGTMPTLLNSLHPSLHYAEGVLSFARPRDRRFRLDGRRLVLVPLISGRDAALASFDLPDVAYIGYPLRRAAIDASASNNGALALVLGPVRAATLRALRRPLTMNELATVVQCVPSTASYHCEQLQAAGLLTRERCGRFVRVSRTARGAQLMDVLSD